MNWLDIIFLLVLVVLVLVGWRAGVHWIAVAVGGSVAGTFVAARYQEDIARVMGGVIASPGANVIAVGLLFLGSVAVAFGAAALARLVLRLVFLGWVTNLAGALLGLVVGLAIIAAFSVAVCRFPMGGLTGLVGDSAVAQGLTFLVRGLLPVDFQQVISLGPCGGALAVLW